MKIIKQYLNRTVLSSVLLVAVFFFGLLVFINFIGELKHLGEGDYTVWQAFLFVLLSIPLEFYMFFPMIGLIGCLLGLGVLASNNELTIMRASGISAAKITRILLVTIISMVVVMTVIGEGFGPYLKTVAEASRSLAENSGQSLAIGSSVWLKQQNNFIYVDKITTENHLQGITVYTFNTKHELTKNLQAKSADYQQNHWLLHQVKLSRISEKGVRSKSYATLPWQLNLAPNVFQMSLKKPDEMNLVELWHFIRSRRANGLKVSGYQINFWQRVYQPLAMIVMMFLAVPFVFGSLRNLTLGFRISIGVIVGFAFIMMSNIVGELSVLVSVPPVLSTLLPIIVFGFLGVVLVNWRIG